MNQITLNYQARGFNIITAFGDGAFKHLADWMRIELHIDLRTCAADSRIPSAENAVRFVKERLRSI